MHVLRKLFFYRKRDICYSSRPIITYGYMPDRLGIAMPIIRGRFLVINYFNGLLLPDEIPFVSFIEAIGDKFKIVMNDLYVNWNDIKNFIGIAYIGDDWKVFIEKSYELFKIEIMLLEPGEIFCVPKTSEYWKNYPLKSNNFKQKITITDIGFYTVLDENDNTTEYIGYYAGEHIIGPSEVICIRLRK